MAPPRSKAAERQKQYRERLKSQNPEKHNATKKKNADRMKENRKRIADCTSEEKESLRQQWRNYKNKKVEDKRRENDKSSVEEEKSQSCNEEGGNSETEQLENLNHSIESHICKDLAPSSFPTNLKRKNHNEKVNLAENYSNDLQTLKEIQPVKNKPEYKETAPNKIHEVPSLFHLAYAVCCPILPQDIDTEKISNHSNDPQTLKKTQPLKNKPEYKETAPNKIHEVPSLFTLAYTVCYPILPQDIDTEKMCLISDENDIDHEAEVCNSGNTITNKKLKEVEELRKKWRDYKRKNKEKQEKYDSQLEKWRNYKNEKVEDDSIKKLKALNKKLENENLVWKTEVIALKKKLKKNRQQLLRTQKANRQLMEKVNKFTEENNVIVTSGCAINEMTPISNSVNTFINENISKISTPEKLTVKKRLLQENVFIHAIQEGYKNLKDHENKRIIKSLVLNNEKVNKYNFKTKSATFLGLKGKIRHSLKNKKNSFLKEKLRQFYERDDVSRATAGKKEYKVNQNNKVQRRYLLNTLKNLHKKYKLEFGSLSFSTFKKYRPFYVIPPKANNCNTCACIKHENLAMKAIALKTIRMIESKSLDDLLPMIVCDPKSKACAYNECDVCRNKQFVFNQNNYNPEEKISWDEWTAKTHEYVDKNRIDTKTTKKIVKETKTGLLKDLIELFLVELQKFKKHAYNIYHQYREYRKCRNNLDEQSILFHIDYSENYLCKLNTEIQAMHFGASRQQITLHTGVMYLKDKKPVTFCSLSPNNYHGPEAIWAHMGPVLDFVKKEHPAVKRAHFFSDGPTSQYRQKKNFHLFSVVMKQYGFTNSTWNFFEASHGKGAADGVGGALKRKLDSFVHYGRDVVNAETAFQLLKKSDTEVQVFYIPEENIQMLTLELMPVPGTMLMHQIILAASGEILYRSLSCFCCLEKDSGECECFDLKPMVLVKPRPKSIAVLSDIKNTEANQKYFDLNNLGPLHLTKINPDHNIVQGCKKKYTTRKFDSVISEMQNKDEPKLSLKAKVLENMKQEKKGKNGRSLAGKRKLHRSKKILNPKRPKTSDLSSTENDTDYSVHDSSEDENVVQEEAFSAIFGGELPGQTLMATYNNNHCSILGENNEISLIQEGEGDLDKDENNEVSLIEQEIEYKDESNEVSPKEDETEYLDEDLLSQDMDLTSSKEDVTEFSVNVNDSVLVRYHQRNNWKYYIGFVESVVTKDTEELYSITFLKTVKKPDLRFIVPKKKDFDMVPLLSILKKIELFQTQPMEYSVNPSDYVYFFDN